MWCATLKAVQKACACCCEGRKVHMRLVFSHEGRIWIARLRQLVREVREGGGTIDLPCEGLNAALNTWWDIGLPKDRQGNFTFDCKKLKK